MTDEQKREARRLYVYEETPVADIATRVNVPIDEVRTLLKIDVGSGQASKPPRPDPSPPRPPELDPDVAVAVALNEEVQRRTAPPSYGNGTRRDGGPAPHDLRSLFLRQRRGGSGGRFGGL